MTKKEQAVLDLVSVDQDVNIVKYKVSDKIGNLEIWLETYEKGKKLEDIKMSSSRKLDSNKGRVAIIVDKEQNYNWKIVFQDDNGKASYSFNTDSDFETGGVYSQASTKLAEKVDIKSDKEIVLSAYIFDNGDGMAIYTPQQYSDDPTRLEEYDFAYLLKCKFVE